MKTKSLLGTVALNEWNRFTVAFDDGKTWWDIYLDDEGALDFCRGDRICVTKMPPRPPADSVAVWSE